MPMMRGFAALGGRLPNTGCDLAALGYADARDIAAVIADLAREPVLDTSRVVSGLSCAQPDGAEAARAGGTGC